MRTTYLSLLAFNSSPSLQLPYPPLFQVEVKRRLGVGGHALVSRLQVPRTLVSHKLKSALKCTVRSQCTPVLDRQTGERHGNSAKIRSNDRIAR